MNAVIESVKLPEPVARRGITEAQWRTLANNLYPGADVNSVLMVWDYCVARKLDPLKRPCHIVPMRVKEARTDAYVWRDVVMPGIYEYRTTATRTGFYMGHSEPIYGPEIDYLGVKAPEFCKFTIYRWNPEAKQRAEYPVKVKFAEVVATAFDKKTDAPYVNARWTKAPEQMLTKCTEAAGLREAFPDELGGTHTVEEMEGQIVDEPQRHGSLAGFDFSEIDNEVFDKWYGMAVDTLNQDKDEYAIAADAREYLLELQQISAEMALAVITKLFKDGVVTKAGWKKLLNLYPTGTKFDERKHG